MLLFALVVGLLSVAPTVLAPLSIVSEYKGVQYLYLNDETIYRARIHEILDGEPSVASPFLFEYKDAKTVVPPINEYFYAVPAYIFGLSGAIIFAKFFFPLVLFLLIYEFVTLLLISLPSGTRRSTGIAVALLVTLGYDLVDSGFIKALLHGSVGTHLLLWTRVVNPIVGVMVGFAALIAVWKIFTTKQKKFIVLLALLMALSVGYFFSFAVCYVFVGLMTLISLVRKEFRVAGMLTLAGVLSVVIDISYWYHSLTMLSGAEGKAASLKNGMFFTHELIINKLVLVATIVSLGIFLFGFFKAKKQVAEDIKSWLFILGLLLTSWIVFAQQVLTGKEVWPDHFVQFTIPFMMICGVVSAALVFSAKFPKLWLTFLSLIVVASVAVGTYSAGSYTHNRNDFIRVQSYGGLFSWLNTAAQNECVVMVREWNEELERMIPAYTHCNVYSTQYVYFGVPEERTLHNFVLRMRLLGVDPLHAEEYLYADENDVRGYFFENWGQLYMSAQGRDAWLDSKVSIIANAYRASLSMSLYEEIHKYRADYLYSEEPLSKEMMKELPDSTVILSTPHYTLYKISPR